MNKQNRNRLTDTENILTVAWWEEGWGHVGKKHEGIMKYKVADMKVTGQASAAEPVIL